MVSKRTWRQVLVGCTTAVVVAGVGMQPAAASPSDVPLPTAKVDCVAFDATGTTCEIVGVVYAMAQVGDRTYVGGRFTSVAGEPRANVAAILGDGSLDPTWNPSTDGTVYALAASSDGSKIFLGGGFTTVGGAAHARLAAVTSDTGALISTWKTAAGNNLVRALATDANDRLYVGGTFGRIGGKAVPRLAALSQSTGAVDTSFAPSPNGAVRALALSDDGTRLYAGGGFNAVKGVARPGAVELESATGAVTSFAPTDGGVVISMDISSDGRLFFGTTSNRTWAYDVSDGGTPEYRVRTGGDVQAILALDDEVYIGGHFDTIPEAKLNRLALASFDPLNGTPTAWNPGANGHFGVWALGLTRTSLSSDAAPALSVGGDFTRVNGQARRGYARFAFSG
jgi:hypothetical protein